MNKIRLDIGCGTKKFEGFTGLDKMKIPGVDIVHDLEVFPYPLDDESCEFIIGSHIIEHIKPWFTIEFFNELWRIMDWNGILRLMYPEGGSYSFWQDPTHCNGFNVTTFQYFDPEYKMYYEIYKPRPWKIMPGYPVQRATDIYEVRMTKEKKNATTT